MAKKKKLPPSPRSRRPGRYSFVIEFHEPDLSRAREIAKADGRALAFIIRRALHWWLQTPDAAMMAIPLEERLRAQEPKAS
jgi:hypothetical protein